VTAAAFAAAAASAFVFIIVPVPVIVIVIVVVTMSVSATASAFVGVLVFRQDAHRVFFDHDGNFVEHSRVFIHLGFQRRVLFGDGAKKHGGIAQQLCSKLSVGWHW
jgi:hypothetical protein